jgi:23S rRNA pseudouridine1911/1915/1917 synthase
MGRADDRTWVEIELETGRTHQIRLQFATRGFPVVGDELYGATTKFGPKTMDSRKKWIALHARRLAFQHPIDHEPVDITAQLSPHWQEFAEFSEELFV